MDTSWADLRFFFFSSRRRHTRFDCDWSSDVCSSDLDWVNFRVNDRLVNDSNPDDSGGRLMRALSGSLGVAVTPSDGVTLYGNVGTSFETPTTTELTNRPRSAGGFNPALQPQKATSLEVGARGDGHG